jgi:predicted DsbA family dithiol-disulfide isomerase
MGHADLSVVDETQVDASTVLHWYDFICPFCYVGQQRNATLTRYGLHVVEFPFQAHADIPPGGISAGPRNGPMYAMLEREAKEAGLPLNWPPRLPNTRRALAAAEWARQHPPESFHPFHRDLFAAHFVLGEDLEDTAVVDRHARASGIELSALHSALADDSAEAAVTRAEITGHKYGVQGTPAWLVARQLVLGLRSAEEFGRLAENAAQLK